MDELDNDFKELCANLLSRVKKKAGDAEGVRKVQSRTRSIATKSKLKKSKSAAKSKSQHDSSAGKRMGEPECTDFNGQALGQEPGGKATPCGNDGPALGGGNGDPPSAIQLDAMSPNCNQNNLADGELRSCFQTASSFAAAAEPAISTSSPAKTLLISGTRLRVAELMLEKMQQFKRVKPKQLKHTRGSSLPETMADGNLPGVSQEKNQLGNVTTPDLLAMKPDVVLAVDLQQELKGGGPGSLEEAGLFFCQICQKDLSAMNTTRREQHVNRCLDELEKSPAPSSSNPQIPECPICGKQFYTPKSRASHLKSCAVKMEVPPQLLLQAVQSQALALGDGLPVPPSNQLNRSKRKGSSKEKESKKKQKTSKVATADEDLLVALAMSRSLLEQKKQEDAKSVTSIKLDSALPVKWKPGAEKKRHKNLPPPPLLLQDPETARKQIENRMAMLLTEEVEFPSTPPLPASRILEDEPRKAAWLLSLPKDQRCILWEYSTLTVPCGPESFYAVGLTPPILPWKPVQSHKSGTILPSVGSDEPQLFQQLQTSRDHPNPASVGLGSRASDDPQTGPDGAQQFLSCSQKDVQTLQDLVELAGEGLTLTQWNLDIDHTRAVEQLRGESEPSDIPLSGFVPPSKEKMCKRSSPHTSSLRSLAADFSGMVNNPHLSDVQFQVDCGEVLYAHMFVLYARCPRLTEVVHNEGFLVEEDGNLHTRRVLLSEVTAEAVRAFLQYLYAADTSIPSRVLSDVGALAVRFGVSELISVCGKSPEEEQEHAGVDSEDDPFSGGEEENCENRDEYFRELLRSMWVDEDEEEVALLEVEDQEEEDNEKVDEQELEEIYEFVATQRKILQDEAEVEEGTGSSMYCETEEAQNMNRQTEDEEVKVSESPSTTSMIKEWKENFDLEISCESPGQEKKIQGVRRSESMSVTQITPVHVQNEPCECRDDAASHGGASDEREISRRRPKVVKVYRSSQASQSEEEDDAWEKLVPSCRHNGDGLSKSYDHMFSTTPRKHCEPPSLNEDNKESREISSETYVEINSSPIYHQSQTDLLSGRGDLCSSPLINPCSPVLPAVGSSPMSPESNKAFSKASTEISPLSAPKQNKNKGLFQTDSASFQKAREQDDASGLEKIIKNTLSPAKSPPIDLKKQKHVPTCLSLVLTTPNTASHKNQEADVILLLDSDEEMELEQVKEKSDSESPLREMEISRRLDCNCRKMEQEHEVPELDPISVADPEIQQVSLGIPDEVHSENAVMLSPEMPLNNQVGTCIDNRLNLSQKGECSREESSSMDTSWLVPDTPLVSRSRNCSTQTQATSICCLSSQGSKHTTKDLLVNNSDHKLAGKTMKVPEITSDPLLATSSQKHLHTENFSVSKRTFPDSPFGQSWKDSLQVPPVSPVPLSPACVHVKEKSPESPSSPRRGLPCHGQSLENKTDISVVEIEESEEEKDEAPVHSSGSFLLIDEPPVPVDDNCWNVECLSPIKDNNKVLARFDCANTSSPVSGKSGSQHDQWETPTRALEITGSTPFRGNPVNRRQTLLCHEKSPVEAHSSVGSRLSFLNSKVWDDWDEDELPDILPLTQMVSAAAAAQNSQPLKTPEPACHKRNQQPIVPITPIPSYSIMETPELKKELNRFGVRPLPKRQMVLKLKEIFQYTHQIMSSDSEDEIPSSQAPLKKATAMHPSQPKADLIAVRKESSKASSVESKQKLGVLVPSLPVLGSGDDDSSAGPSTTGCLRTKKIPKTKGCPARAKVLKGATLSPARSPVKGSLVGNADEQMLSASQESAASSVAGSDNSFGSQSSSNEFETNALTSEEDEEIPASQAAAREADKLEAVRRYIHSNPVLYQKILFYQPFELTGLQAELKQNGIRIALGKLLDFLDAHCITFTTAGARKEKQQQRGGKKKRGKRY